MSVSIAREKTMIEALRRAKEAAEEHIEELQDRLIDLDNGEEVEVEDKITLLNDVVFFIGEYLNTYGKE